DSAITVAEPLKVGDGTGTGDEQLIVRGDRGPILDELFNLQRGVDALYATLVAADGPPSDTFENLALTVVAQLTDNDPNTYPSPQLIKDLGKAYLANWSAAIDA